METSNQNQMEIFTFLLNDSQNDVNCPKKKHKQNVVTFQKCF